VKLQHEYEVPASPDETLALLLDPERVVPRMPGARVVELVGAQLGSAAGAVPELSDPVPGPREGGTP
jgi:carbon monoxide dehydrogenase subunit G